MRREALRSTYLFECHCSRCEREADSPNEPARAEAAAQMDAHRQKEHQAIESAEWGVALTHSLKARELGCSIYPGGSAPHGLQCLRAGKLALHQEEMATALKCLSEAVSILSVSHGKESALVAEAGELLREAQMEARMGGLRVE